MTKAPQSHPFNMIDPHDESIALNNEQRLRILLEIIEFKTDNLQQLLEFTLEKVIEITSSKIGYIYYYDEERRIFTLNSWSKNVMNECSITEPMTEYELDKTGIWGEVVRQRQPILINDFEAENPLKKGYPEGHVHLKKFLAIPVIYNEQIVANVGVANKETDYTDDDILQLKLLMDAVWKRIIEKDISTKLSEQKDRAQLYLDIVPVIILSLDLEGNVKMVNEQGLRLLKANIGDVLNKNWVKNFIPESEHEQVFKAFDTLKQGSEDASTVAAFENSIIDLEKQKHIISWKNRIIRNEKGEIVEIISAGQDITNTKAIESTLVNVEQKFSIYIEKSPQGIFVANKEGNYLLVNPAACEMLGYTQQELLSMNVTQIVPEEDKEKTLSEFTQLLQTGSLKKRYRMLKKDGKIVIILINAVMLPNGEAVAFCEDVTDEAMAEKQIREQNEQLKRINQMMIDRELKMVELKERLKKETDQPN